MQFIFFLSALRNHILQLIIKIYIKMCIDYLYTKGMAMVFQQLIVLTGFSEIKRLLAGKYDIIPSKHREQKLKRGGLDYKRFLHIFIIFMSYKRKAFFSPKS